MLSEYITRMDFKILNWIQAHLQCEFLDHFFPMFTSLGEKGWFFLLIAGILLAMPKTRKWGAGLACGLLLGLVFGNLLIKNMVARTRPYDLVDDFIILVNRLSDYSFPSGHTLAAFEFLAVICMMPVKKIYKALAGILAFTMAFSRLYLYVHFPSDVLAAMLLGTLFGIIGVRIVTMVMEERSQGEE